MIAYKETIMKSTKKVLELISEYNIIIIYNNTSSIHTQRNYGIFLYL